ncbi:voltage-gated potassium channel [Pseudomonas sp. PA1(2017)]|uniref:pentapeptide repeat-containing protein n=1 Tax=Pseudomonas sp. PA1(2017) TaxID=1932113 RepID=UPI000965A1C3|nr:pentapeptide repeat-containing protein [Pseudomonas sp. PA1(2017)]OLU16982.1 voltage-gated potassium channel [Pseudomonas sp. PA1(2017)]
MDKDGFKFDLQTQRFLVNRWDTEVGSRVRDEVLEGLKSSTDIRSVLDPYVLKHKDNIEPYGYPIYPPDAMTEGDFWVLTQDDLRGIRFYNEDVSNTPSLAKKALSYASFYNCNLSGSSLEMTELSYARFEKCDLTDTAVVASGGFCTRMTDCTAVNASFWLSGFRECDFSGTDLRGAYFDGTLIEDMKVNYLTRFDLTLRRKWKKRTLPADQQPDLLRSIRMAYERAELWSQADGYFYREKTEQRKHVLWPHLKRQRCASAVSMWSQSLVSGVLSGYATKPLRVLVWGMLVSILFTCLYAWLGVPTARESIQDRYLESLYLSLTTFTTLGFGDVTYGVGSPWLRVLTTVEALIGAIWISLFVVVLAKKVFR